VQDRRSFQLLKAVLAAAPDVTACIVEQDVGYHADKGDRRAAAYGSCGAPVDADRCHYGVIMTR
jgi:hypothetical protein